MLRRRLTESEDGSHGPPLVGNYYAVHLAVIAHEAANGGLPVDGLTPGRFHPDQVGVFHVDQQAAPLAKVTEQGMPDHLGGPLASINRGRPIHGHFKYEAIVAADSFLTQALRVREQACGTFRI